MTVTVILCFSITWKLGISSLSPCEVSLAYWPDKGLQDFNCLTTESLEEAKEDLKLGDRWKPQFKLWIEKEFLELAVLNNGIKIEYNTIIHMI